MIRRSKIVLAIGIALLLISVLGAITTFSKRVQIGRQLIAMKLEGGLPNLDWGPMLAELALGRIYRKISNPFASASDLSAGAETFRFQCAACHGGEGRGGIGPDLASGQFRYGSSDLALFKTISQGVTGTGMTGFDLPAKSIWQVIAYVRSLGRGSHHATEKVSNGGDKGQTAQPPQVSYERLLRGRQEVGDWLMYSGAYDSQRFSFLDQINTHNVKNLGVKWVYQMGTAEKNVESTPLVVNGIMYVTEPPNSVIAIGTRTGERIWSYHWPLPEELALCCGRTNRGLAVLGDTLYMGTLDAHLIALDARTGALLWDVEVADNRVGYSINGAPLAIKDQIIVGVSGGEFGVRGFLDAYEAATGKRNWRFYTIPGPSEPGHETWSGDSWKTGGGATWLTGSFDPELNLIYWGVGNPSPPYSAGVRQGDNLYSNSVVALDVDTGKLKWHFQFTPHDKHDWDAVQIPILVDAAIQDEPRKLMLFANRNGFFYLLDRQNGEFLHARAFAKQTWAKGIDVQGRPILNDHISPSEEGTLVYPGGFGATNWWSPTYSPRTGLEYVSAMEYGSIYFERAKRYRAGAWFTGGRATDLAEEPGTASIRAILPETGEIQWEYGPVAISNRQTGGLLSTQGDLVFGGIEDEFFALDARTGKKLWQLRLGARIRASPITYQVEGKQRISVAAGRGLFTFGLQED